jgi:outer membrane protein assembly factor BamB
LLKKSLAVGIILLFIISSITPMVFGYNEESLCSNNEENKIYEKSILLSGPMDSPWPMKCHDIYHTGRSPYSTADNPGIEKWRFKCSWVEDGIVIGNDGTLYFGDEDWYFYAINPDGILKWEYRTGGDITSAPAIDEDGTIYVNSWDDYLYALYSNNGTLKWKFYASSAQITSSPAIGEDGTIYFGTMWSLGDGGKIFAVNPDGTEKWWYQTGSHITSDPAIGDDGTVYIGSQDSYLYAMYPNGTLRWKFKTGGLIQGSPSIDIDRTIYIGSYDDYLYALNPDGSLKWKCKIGAGTATNPSIGIDGTIYVGGSKLYAIYPNGDIKWNFDVGPEQFIGFSSPAISADGTIYFGTRIGYDGVEGGDIVAVNPDGTEKWRKRIANNYYVDSSPCIAEDGTVYIGSTYNQGKGYLHAFGPVESNVPPDTPTITGTTNGKAREEYYYTFTSIDPDNNPVSYYIDWGDDTTTETMDFASGEIGSASHTYNARDEYTIRAKAKDTLGEESDWATLKVSMPNNKVIISPFFRFLENHTPMFPILRKIIGQ